ncbi:hypothetical protein O181_096089 [Austropuccinia psidii MF-1]|uniref:Uncharacterized protein n=1 Tax=Austropuccinia psidii MF-1 TaxID=1389203 RepID=A0A9Q3J6L9_9BASI|nr:hypothetical protein [Austropuccinia psidii MF-1]
MSLGGSTSRNHPTKRNDMVYRKGLLRPIIGLRRSYAILSAQHQYGAQHKNGDALDMVLIGLAQGDGNVTVLKTRHRNDGISECATIEVRRRMNGNLQDTQRTPRFGPSQEYSRRLDWNLGDQVSLLASITPPASAFNARFCD